MAAVNEPIETIEACRTCGIYYMTNSNYLKHLFQSPNEQPEIMLIRLELAQWKVEVSENDGFPQYVCSTCIHEFEKLFKFRSACVETQEQFRHFYNLREENRTNIKIKTELQDFDEDKPIYDFIYIDDLSDNDYDGTTPFNIPHVPIKEEVIEAAVVPMEESEQIMNMVESASRVVVQHVSSAQIPRLNQQNESVIKTPASVIERVPSDQGEFKLNQQLSSSQEKPKEHVERTHQVRDLECHICGKKFKNSTLPRLKFHMKWHTLNKHIKCTQCGFVCNSKETLQEHKSARHSKIICKICGKGVLAKKMKLHLREHILLTKYPCEYCTEAFSSENERETHIWQIHAKEDNENSTSNSQSEIVEVTNLFKISHKEMICQELQNDILNFEFICAHCEERFEKQIELEVHVNQKHRHTTHLTTLELETSHIGQELVINVTENAQKEDYNEHSNIAVFENYDDFDSNELLQHEHSNQSNHSILNVTPKDTNLLRLQPNSADQTVNTKNEQEHQGRQLELENEQCKIQAAYQNDLAPSSPKSENSVSDNSEEKSVGFISEYTSNELNQFACAKCSETFATIEQLRRHHEHHLAVVQPQLQEIFSKSKFKCNLCGKSFDLKFSLNRHVKKHKNAPF